MGKQQRDNAMFEYLELYVHVDIITDNHDLFSQLKQPSDMLFVHVVSSLFCESTETFLSLVS